MNQIAEQNPEYIDYLKERYPKSDPRLSQLRYKMDQMLSASDEYIETHFPENQKLFKKSSVKYRLNQVKWLMISMSMKVPHFLLIDQVLLSNKCIDLRIS